MLMGSVATKFRRALQSNTGLRLTADEVTEIAKWGGLDLISAAENLELCPERYAPSSPPPALGQLPVLPETRRPLTRASIAELGERR